MFKKILSLALVVSMFSTMSVFAIGGNYLTSITLTPSGTFDPNTGTLGVSVVWDATEPALSNVSGYVKIFQNATEIASLQTWTNTTIPASPINVTWDGKCGAVNCPDGIYIAKVEIIDTAAVVNENLISTFNLVSSSSSLDITSLTTTPASNFDPSDSGENEILQIVYTANQTPDTLTAVIKNDENDEMKTIYSNPDGSLSAWDGELGGKIVEPGTYTVDLTANKAGLTSDTESVSFTVAYNNTSKPSTGNLTINPSSFDPDYEDTSIEFTNNETANLTVTIEKTNGDHVASFSSYTDDSYSDSSSQSIIWDGKNDSGSDVSIGTYKVKILARNDFGVSVQEASITVNNTGSGSSSNSHIDDFSLRPSTFEPGEDDEISIEFDILKDLDDLEVWAIRGSEEIELLVDSSVDEQDNFEITWDGTDDDGDFVDEGSWRIEARTSIGSIELTASRSVSVEYEKPEIEDIYVSKSKFDNDEGEFVYIMFRTDTDALVDVNIFEGNRLDDDFIEELEVYEDKWTAVLWDGDNYDYDDDLDIEIVARNKENENVFDSEKISIDLSEDDVSSSRSNVTLDFIDPPASDGRDGFSIFYNLEDDAEVTVTIHKGTSSSGTKVAELMKSVEQDAGDHTIQWNGKEDDGDWLKKGVYTYKIVSKTGGTETESGKFIVGETGDVDGGSFSGSSSSSSSSSVGSNVIVDGGGSSTTPPTPNPTPNPTPTVGLCAGFTDVMTSSTYCNAITWAKGRGIFNGYDDGTFRPYSPINRAEILKVILEAYNVVLNSDNNGTAGFIDVASGSWYVGYIKSAVSLGVFSGDAGKSTARPGDTVNRVEALKMVFETLGVVFGTNLPGCDSAPYNDVSLGLWYSDYACASKAYNLFDLGSGVNFTPSAYSTRGEMAEVLYRMYLAGLL